MSSSVNKWIGIGHIGRDPELRFTQNGKAVLNFSIATTERWNDTNNAKQERVEWHRIVVWGKLAETCAKLLYKGRLIYVEGRLQTRSYTDNANNKFTVTEIIANEINILSRPVNNDTPKDNNDKNLNIDNSNESYALNPDEEINFDDIPF